jgi:LPS-assembly lipoprotein
LLILCLAMVLQACGFKPRGAVELPPVMDNTFIGGVPFDPMVIALRDAFENAGVVVVERKAEATAVLRLLQNSFDRRTLSVDANGKVVEYALQFRVRFDVVDPQDQEVVRPQTVELTRGYLNPDTEVLGKSLEEESLQDEMRRDLARSILRRIQAQLG